MVINIFKKKTKDVKDEKNLVLICALFVHAAKMDENYTDKEKSIILKALSDISNKKESNLEIVLKEAEKKESHLYYQFPLGLALLLLTGGLFVFKN
mgnify:CR=1 FL=1